MSTPPPKVDGYASIQPSRGSYIAGSFKESFICAGIWAILAAVFISGIRLWSIYSHPGKGMPTREWAVYIGNIIGQFVLMTIYLSVVLVYRRRKNVTSLIFFDWRWWVGLVIFSVLLKNPPTGWLWVGVVYQVRLGMNPRSPSSTTIAAVSRRLLEKISQTLRWFVVVFVLGGSVILVTAAWAQELPLPTTEVQAPKDSQPPQTTPPTESKTEEEAKTVNLVVGWTQAGEYKCP